jgi:hypothetical protein
MSSGAIAFDIPRGSGAKGALVENGFHSTRIRCIFPGTLGARWILANLSVSSRRLPHQSNSQPPINSVAGHTPTAPNVPRRTTTYCSSRLEEKPGRTSGRWRVGEMAPPFRAGGRGRDWLGNAATRQPATPLRAGFAPTKAFRAAEPPKQFGLD